MTLGGHEIDLDELGQALAFLAIFLVLGRFVLKAASYRGNVRYPKGKIRTQKLPPAEPWSFPWTPRGPTRGDFGRGYGPFGRSDPRKDGGASGGW